MYHDGDRVIEKGTIGPTLTVIGPQRGRWVGVRADGSTNVRDINRDGYGTSGVDRAVLADDLVRVP